MIPLALAFMGGLAVTLVRKRPGIFLPLAFGAAIGFASQAGLIVVLLCTLAGMAGAFVAVSINRR